MLNSLIVSVQGFLSSALTLAVQGLLQILGTGFKRRKHTGGNAPARKVDRALRYKLLKPKDKKIDNSTAIITLLLLD